MDSEILLALSGSQHVILNRKFVEYSIQGWENLPRLLLLYFTNTRSSHRGYFQTLACNTMEFSDAVINSNLRFINSDNTARDPSDFRAPSSDRILKREVAFVGNVSADSPLLDMIDAHILHRGHGMVSPGGWCLGSSNWFSDPCGEWGDPSVLRPGPAAKGLENFLMKSIKNMSIKSSRCDHQWPLMDPANSLLCFLLPVWKDMTTIRNQCFCLLVALALEIRVTYYLCYSEVTNIHWKCWGARKLSQTPDSTKKKN